MCGIAGILTRPHGDAALEAAGAEFRSSSDARTMLEKRVEHGPDWIGQLREHDVSAPLPDAEAAPVHRAENRSAANPFASDKP